ncbi:MAG: hypothetical protein WCK91_01770 [bacterium]
MASKIRITSVPDGGAPLWVRQKWVGLTLPFWEENSEPLANVGALAEGKLERTPCASGYTVRWSDAMAALRDGDAQAWWRTNFNPPLKNLVFSKSCCTVVEKGLS